MENFSFKKQAFVFSGSDELNVATGGTSDPIQFLENYLWSVSPNAVGAAPTAGATYTVQASSDGNTWFDYSSLLTDVAIADSLDVEGFGFPLMRLVVTGGGTGTVKFELTQKLLK